MVESNKDESVKAEGETKLHLDELTGEMVSKKYLFPNIIIVYSELKKRQTLRKKEEEKKAKEEKKKKIEEEKGGNKKEEELDPT
jgi:hypothetical protein